MDKEQALHIVIDSIPSPETSTVEIVINSISTLLVPVIAILTAYIAFRQYRINKQRFLHERYERRLSIYKSIQRYLSEVVAERQTNLDRALMFKTEVSEAAFIFDKSVQKKTDEIFNKSLSLISKLSTLTNRDDLDPLVRERIEKSYSDVIQWYVNEVKELPNFFTDKIEFTK